MTRSTNTKKDRQPKPAGQKPEPLLSFPSGALVHFAVSNREVQMATKLEGFKTFFLPLQQRQRSRREELRQRQSTN